MIVFSCRCGKRFQANERDAGRRARCPACAEMVVVPGPGGGDARADEPQASEASREESLKRRAALGAFARGLSAPDDGGRRR